MRFYLVLVLVCLLGTIEAKSKKKLNTDEVSPSIDVKTKRKIKNAPSAIVAIEIVDPKESKTGSKNSKRTIDSSLGYGYQSFVGATHQQPKYEVYKYSQHDIPPFKGSNYNTFATNQRRTLSYKFPVGQKYTNVVQNPQSYQTGTTLYSTVNQHGQLGGLSSQIPHSSTNHGASPIPVIILRVNPNQLADNANGLYPKLPQTHPLASNLNSIDLQSLLASYFQAPSPQLHSQQQPQQEYQTEYQYQQPSQQYLPQSPQQDYNVHYQEPQQYVSSQYQQPAYETQETPSHSSSNGLLTHENYPSERHTKVIFRDHKGRVKTAEEQEESHISPVQTKTIKVHVPAGISGVEVQTPSAQYSYTNQLPEDNQSYQTQAQPQHDEGALYYYYNTQIDQQQGQMYQPHNDQTQIVYQSQPSQQYSQSSQTYEQNNYQEQPKYSETSQQSQPQYTHSHQKRRLRSKKSSDDAMSVVVTSKASD